MRIRWQYIYYGKEIANKRGLTGAESAEKERQIAETIKAKKKKDDAATVKKAEKNRIAIEKITVAAAKIVENVRVKKA
jgi:hypothetical protein